LKPANLSRLALPELMKESRFTHARLARDADDLAMTSTRSLEGAVEKAEFGDATDEGREPSAGRDLESSTVGAVRGDFKQVQWLCRSIDVGGSKSTYVEEAGSQLVRRLTHQDGAGKRERLDLRGQVGSRSHGRVIQPEVVLLDGAKDHLTRMDSDGIGAGDTRSSSPYVIVPAYERTADCSMGMVLVGSGGAEERKDSVAQGLRDISFELSNRIDHELQHGIDDSLHVFGIQILDPGRRANQVGKQDRDGPPLSLGIRNSLPSGRARLLEDRAPRHNGVKGRSAPGAEARIDRIRAPTR
jgi:hypothetical protein